MKTIAERIKEALELRDMKQSDLVSATGIGKSSISTYLSGDYEPKQKNIYKIAQALNVSEAWLMGFDVPISRESNNYPHAGTDLRQRPLVGRIACGSPIIAEQNIEQYLSVPDGVECDFMLECHGDSMTGARIMDGDIVYIHAQPEVENGQIAAVRIGEEATLKRFYRNGETVTLMPDNPKYPPMMYMGAQLDDIQVLGLAVAFTSNIK